MKAIVAWAFVLGLLIATSTKVKAAGRVDLFDSPRTLIVSPDGSYTTIQAALQEATDGDTIEVHPGMYLGNLVVDKSVRLEGKGWPVIDGGDQGTVITLTAPGIVLQGFELRGSGDEPDRDHAGITLVAPDITVENNRLSDVLFGIFVAQADRAVVRNNNITSKAEYDVARKGDGIRLWYSNAVIVEGNDVHAARDVVMWYSKAVLVKNNRIQGGRYGIHLMYCDGAQIKDNQLLDNSVGIYTMYSKGVSLIGNDIRRQRGTSGYALGFKDADAVEVVGNLLVDNRAGIFLDGTPFSPSGFANFEDNILAFNDIGALLLTVVRGANFEGNTFWENIEQVSLQGGGKAGENRWQDNYWSDYAGFDADSDGRGDTIYRSERFFENLTDREPLLRALIYSPAAQTIEFAAASFPVFRPQAKLTDESPKTNPSPLPPGAAQAQGEPGKMILSGLSLLIIGLLIGKWFLSQGGVVIRSNQPITSPKSPGSVLYLDPDKTQGREGARRNWAAQKPALRAFSKDAPLLQVAGVVKRYGKLRVLDTISFEVQAGEALALWGPNGAGKTTLIKAILGLIDYQGSLQIAGFEARQSGKVIRSKIGYVPQEAAYYDMSVQATMAFYARLKKVNAHRIQGLLEELGLIEHVSKPVSALSGGLKQRLALGIALLSDPPILLLDEPTANLDTQGRRDYLALLATLRREQKTILFASHRVEEVEALADRILVMEAGRVTQDLKTGDLRVRLTPHVEITLWIPDAQRPLALRLLQQGGLDAHLNGRGTVVVRVKSDEKLHPLNLLGEQGITVLDFEVEKGRLWN